MDSSSRSPRLMPEVARTFGHISGFKVDHHFDSREALVRSGVHGSPRQGIHGDHERGAFSIRLSGKYEDDDDRGDTITYVGSGGRDKTGKTQIADQLRSNPGNNALYLSAEKRTPVRVIRRSDARARPSRTFGYRYDGLYVVDSATKKKGRAGFMMCTFELSRIRDEDNCDLSSRIGDEDDRDLSGESALLPSNCQ
ncbi:PUA-like domain containing protein [Tylopilus felleus]